MLDRTRPLWEVHVIDGLSEGRFALYQRCTTPYADGVTMTRWTEEGMAHTASDHELKPVWTLKHDARSSKLKKRNQERMRAAFNEAGGATRRILGVSRLAAMLFLEGVKLTRMQSRCRLCPAPKRR